MLALAEAQIESGNPKEALTVLDQLVMSDPENIMALAMRADLKESKLDDAKGAKIDFQRGGSFIPDTPEKTVWTAYCKHRTGKSLDADAMVEKLSESADKDTAYLMAAYYSATGNIAKGREWLQKAVGQGYADLYNLNSNTHTLLNVAPLR